MRADRAAAGLSAVFLDRDGVINRKAPEGEYVISWAEFELLPRAQEGLRLLADAPFPVIVATNQRGVARGKMSLGDLGEIHRRMLEAVKAGGGRIDAVYYCPHDEGCRCRKPEVGMFEDAARDLNVDLSRAAVVGDSASDLVAAERIGALRVMVGSHPSQPADYIAGDLADAARWLLERSVNAAWGSR